MDFTTKRRPSTVSAATMGLLRSAIVDAAALYRKGVYWLARERVVEALYEQQARHRNRTIGEDFAADEIGKDIADLTGLDQTMVRELAREVLADSPTAAIARAMSASRKELCGGAK